ncbi:protein JINGUBANG-like [Capsicum annuum]|uniref:protein JINGUBANG-like n=1 Tax=Capsicum annuum TaxID=4072 RepID=UPI001FB18CEC|nr:protein JINGUBANG-like [Capsicum annuum]
MEVPLSTWFCNNGQYYEDANSEKQSTTSTTYEENTSSCSIDTFVNISPSSYCIATFKTSTPQISHLAIYNNILYAASLNEITAIDLKTYELIDTFTSSSFGLVKSIAFSKTKIFTAHQDCKIRIWKIKPSSSKNHHHLLSTLPTLKDRIRRGISPKNYVQIRRHKQKLWIEHADTVSGLAVNDGLMYSVSWDKTLKIWKMSDFSCLESVLGHFDAINAVVVSHDGVVYTASADGEVKVWQRENNKHSLVTTLRKHKSSVNALALNRDGTILFSGGCDENILVWVREECADYMLLTWSLKGHKGAILCLVYFDGVLISGSSDRSTRIWEKSNSSNKECGYFCSIVLEGHCKPVNGSLDGEIRVWQVNIVSVSR